MPIVQGPIAPLLRNLTRFFFLYEKRFRVIANCKERKEKITIQRPFIFY
jgi:hypothetical protein